MLHRHVSLPLWLSALTCEMRFELEGFQGHFQFHSLYFAYDLLESH